MSRSSEKTEETRAQKESSQSIRLWENVRHFLAGLGAQAAVRSIGELPLAPDAAVRVGLLPQASSRGLPKRAWDAECRVFSWMQPLLPGVGDLTSRLAMEAVQSGQGGGVPREPLVRTLPTELTGMGTVSTHASDWQVLSSPCREASVQMIGLGAARRLKLPSPQTLRVGPLPVPRPALAGKRADLRAPLALSPGRIRSGLSLINRLPLTRRRQAPPPGLSVTDGFPAERHRLALGAMLPPDDVSVLGVFPGIPIGVLLRLVVSPTGETLELWLKPDAPAGSARTLRTLVIGRETTTGKRLQAVL